MTLAYLTYLEPISGVFEGQVIDVCAHLEQQQGAPVQLVSILSHRDFEAQRDKLLARAPGAKGIRSWFGWRAWPAARKILSRQVAGALPPETSALLARGPIATQIALDLRARGAVERVGYDGRGAVSAEWSEYDVAANTAWKSRIERIERAAILSSNMRVAVSSSLVSHWRERFGYEGHDHVVIPCTLSAHHSTRLEGQDAINRRRVAMGLSPHQTVICYAGSEAEWQSIAQMDPWLDTLLARDPDIALLMMTRADLSGTAVMAHHPDRVHQTWVTPDKVRETMAVADFGLLVRSASVTNRVAAPTKFAEYLAAGLQVLISPGVGDYSDMVEKNGLGAVCDLEAAPPRLAALRSDDKRPQMAAFAERHFTKAAHQNSYATLLKGLVGGPAAPFAPNRIQDKNAP